MEKGVRSPASGLGLDLDWERIERDASLVVDTETRRKVAEISIGRQPHDVTFSSDGRNALVTNRMDDTLSVIDVASREVRATVPVGDEPHGLLLDGSGDFLYVLNSGQDSISMLDSAGPKWAPRPPAPWQVMQPF